jgi:hypothetical protein
MDEERSLAEFLGYVSEADGVGDFGGGYVYRETTAEVLAAGLRLVTYRNALNGEEAAKALAILKSHDWRTDVLPFGFTRRVLPWGALEGGRFELPEKPDGYGRLRFTYPQHNMLDRIVHAPVDLYLRWRIRPHSADCSRWRENGSPLTGASTPLRPHRRV